MQIGRRCKRSFANKIIEVQFNAAGKPLKCAQAMSGVNLHTDVNGHILLRTRLLDKLLKYSIEPLPKYWIAAVLHETLGEPTFTGEPDNCSNTKSTKVKLRAS